jgi:hypothetical protein
VDQYTNHFHELIVHNRIVETEQQTLVWYRNVEEVYQLAIVTLVECLYSPESLLLNRNKSDLHSTKSAPTNYNLGLIIESYLHYDYTNIYSYFRDTNSNYVYGNQWF